MYSMYDGSKITYPLRCRRCQFCITYIQKKEHKTKIQCQCSPNTAAVQMSDLVQWSWSVSPGEVPHIGAGETVAQTHRCRTLPSVPTAARCHSWSNKQQLHVISKTPVGQSVAIQTPPRSWAYPMLYRSRLIPGLTQCCIFWFAVQK